MKKILLIIALISFSVYSQKDMVLINGYSENLEEFKEARKASKFDYEKFPEIDTVLEEKMPRSIRVKISERTITLNSYYKEYPNIYRLNLLYAIGKFYKLKSQATDRVHVMSQHIDIRKERIYKFRRSRLSDLKELIKLLEDYKPLITK
jgi:hypothetical protein